LSKICVKSVNIWPRNQWKPEQEKSPSFRQELLGAAGDVAGSMDIYAPLTFAGFVFANWPAQDKCRE
jgi:hypothetical protein